jgi:hypothetical protein
LRIIEVHQSIKQNHHHDGNNDVTKRSTIEDDPLERYAKFLKSSSLGVNNNEYIFQINIFVLMLK